ncbi:MAG TPA: hypothetical protein VI636_18450, partial [Candidatus Angelobacter sp.]
MEKLKKSQPLSRSGCVPSEETGSLSPFQHARVTAVILAEASSVAEEGPKPLFLFVGGGRRSVSLACVEQRPFVAQEFDSFF